MLFQVYGDTAIYQWIGWILVFCCLIGANELARRTKTGGVIAFLIVPAILTIYFITIYVAAAMGAEWALSNPTYVHMTSWFHYAKLYAATAGCIGFMALKYKWGKIGKSEWFKCFPFVIVAINILIAVASDFESAIRAWGTTWVSTEGVTLYGGWHNVFNGVAGLINIACMTGWFGIYVSKKKQDMLWPDMTWASRCCSPRPWRTSSGTRAAGFRTAPTRSPSGACSRRCSPCSRMSPSSPCSR